MSAIVTTGPCPLFIARPMAIRRIVVGNTLNATRWLWVTADNPTGPRLVLPHWLGANTTQAGYVQIDVHGVWMPSLRVGLSSSQTAWAATTDGIATIIWTPA
jgi:hypothetical protein